MKNEVSESKSSRLHELTLEPSNTTSLEPLKEGWRWVRLAQVCEKFVNGGTPDTNVPTYWDGTIPWITGADITSFWVSGGRKFITEEGLKNSATHLVRKNTVLVVTRTGVGKVGIATNDLCFSQDITGIICGKETYSEYLARFILSQENNLIRIQRGATIKGLTRTDIENLEIPLPTMPEQKRIAAKLQELMQEVERARTACEQQLRASKALPSAYLREVFESEAAKEWERKRLGEVCEIIMGQSPPGSTYNKENVGLPFFQGKIDFGSISPIQSTWCSEPIKIARPDDVLISVRAPVGPTNMANQKCCIGRGLAAIRSKNNIEPWFLLYLFRFVERNLSETYGGRGSTFGAMNKEHLQDLDMLVPPLPEQKRIAAELKEKMAEVEKLRRSIEKQLEAINALPQAVLRKAFRGEL
ncbi:MAG: restriction endonuclease subunit S [Thermodesulfobacteriota bacterium]